MLTLLYRNSRLLALTVILILVWGISSYLALPRLEDPELVSRNAVIKTFIRGADAKRVEALITNKIEEKLTEIEEIDNYQSTSSAGSSIISVELEDSTEKEEVEKVWAQVLNKIDQVKPELPSEASEPELEKIKAEAEARAKAEEERMKKEAEERIKKEAEEQKKKAAEAVKDKLKDKISIPKFGK